MSIIKTKVKITKVAKSEKNPNLTIISMEDGAKNRIFQQNWGESDLTRAKAGDHYIIQGQIERKYFPGDDGKQHYADWFKGQPVCKVER